MNEEYRGSTIAYNPTLRWYIVDHEDRGHFETAEKAQEEINERLNPSRSPDEQPFQP